MKIKIVLVVVLPLFSLFTHAQDAAEMEILDKTYTAEYNAAKSQFKICETYGNDLNCYSEIIEKTDISAFVKVMDKKRASYNFNILGQTKKLADFNTIDYSLVTVYADSLKLATIGSSVRIKLKGQPEDFPTFIVKKKDTSNYDLSGPKEILKLPITIAYPNDITTNSDGFKTLLKAELTAIDTSIASYYKVIIEKKFAELFNELNKTKISGSQEYLFIASEGLVPHTVPASTISKNYSFYSFAQKDKIYIKVCESATNEDCKIFGQYNITIEEGSFIKSMLTEHTVWDKEDGNNKIVLGKVYYMIKSNTEKESVTKAKKQFNDDLSSRLQKIENEGKAFSGQIVINKKVDLYYENQLEKASDSIRNWYLKKIPRSKNKISKDKHLIVDSVNIRFFNNRADNITIVGRLSDDKANTRILTNSSYSLPLREFRDRSQTRTIHDKYGEKYIYYYDDILDYLPYKNRYNYAVKNEAVKIGVNDSIKLVQRKIGDYFTGIFFSDFLGLNSGNSNGLIIAEGRIRVPWNFRNYRRRTLFDNITAYASLNLFSGFESSSRRVLLEDTEDSDETSKANAEKFTTDNFNLLSNNNIDAGVLVTPYTFEWKGASTFIHFRYGLRFLRTGAKYNLKKEETITDGEGNQTTKEAIVEERSFQVFSLGQEAEINFEIRPQATVGADLTVGLNWLSANGTNKNDVDFSTTNNAPNLKIMANLYALTNSEEKSSGVYFRLGGHYNLGNYKVFPQIMVGYATNLSSFVNKLKKDGK